MGVNENLWQVNKVLVEKKYEDIFSFLNAPTRMDALAEFDKNCLLLDHSITAHKSSWNSKEHSSMWRRWRHK